MNLVGIASLKRLQDGGLHGACTIKKLGFPRQKSEPSRRASFSISEFYRRSYVDKAENGRYCSE